MPPNRSTSYRQWDNRFESNMADSSIKLGTWFVAVVFIQIIDQFDVICAKFYFYSFSFCALCCRTSLWPKSVLMTSTSTHLNLIMMFSFANSFVPHRTRNGRTKVNKMRINHLGALSFVKFDYIFANDKMCQTLTGFMSFRRQKKIIK